MRSAPESPYRRKQAQSSTYIISLLWILLLLSFSQVVTCTTTEVVPLVLGENQIPLLAEDPNKEALYKQKESEGPMDSVEYEALFSTLGHSLFGKRASAPEELTNNKPATVTISSGQTLQYKFASTQLSSSPTTETPSVPSSFGGSESKASGDHNPELKKREDHKVYISLSVCRQPTPSSDKATKPPPGLKLYVTSALECDPGPGSTSGRQNVLSTDQGFVSHIASVSTDICIAITAPDTPGFTGSYQFELAASIDTFFTNYQDNDSLFVLDTDIKAGMFTTTNLTVGSSNPIDPAIDAWRNTPFSIFVHNQNDSQIRSLTSSYCGMKENAHVIGNAGLGSNKDVTVGLTTTGNSTPSGEFSAKQQFYVPNLNSSSSYYAIMGLATNYSLTGSGPTGGGTLWKAINFTTKTESNCQLIYNLSFCPEVAYAVPSNGSASVAELSAQYDNYTQSLWQGFAYSLAQIPCDTEPIAQYSLATTCANCSAAYRQWLCAVTIPRCTDFSADVNHTLPRNVNGTFPDGSRPPPLNTTLFPLYSNSSRNAMIDQDIKPGPYREVLPCGDLCFGLVQACPAALGFACPHQHKGNSFSESYGIPGGNGSHPFCNMPGAIWGVGAASSFHPPLVAVSLVSAIVSLILASGIV